MVSSDVALLRRKPFPRSKVRSKRAQTYRLQPPGETGGFVETVRTLEASESVARKSKTVMIANVLFVVGFSCSPARKRDSE